MKYRWTLLAALTPGLFAQSLNGVWDATVVVNEVEIPFRTELATQGDKASGSFFMVTSVSEAGG